MELGFPLHVSLFFAFEVVRMDVTAIIILVILGLSGISRRPCVSSTRAESWCLFGIVGDCDPEAVKCASATTLGGMALPGR